jgi:hypothetical protein
MVVIGEIQERAENAQIVSTDASGKWSVAMFLRMRPDPAKCGQRYYGNSRRDAVNSGKSYYEISQNTAKTCQSLPAVLRNLPRRGQFRTIADIDLVFARNTNLHRSSIT